MAATKISKKLNNNQNSNQSKKTFISLDIKLSFILSLVSFVIYANTFNHDFVLDDRSVMAENLIVKKGITAIPEIFSTPYRYGFYVTSNDLYRPLSLVMFAIEYQLFDGKPNASHVINVFVFISCVVLLFLFLNSLFDHKKRGIAFVASLLFAVHPIHTEVVANIKSRDELLCFFFAFLSLNLFIRYVKNGKIKELIFATVCYLLSLFSKESTIVFVLLIPFIFFFYKNEDKKKSIYISVCCVVVSLLFLFIRFSVLNKYNANHLSDIEFIDNMLVNAPDILSRLATAILVLGNYIKLLFLPYPLICDYSYNTIPFVKFNNVWVIFSLIVYVVLFLIGIYRLIKYKKDILAFGILFFLITIVLFSNIPILIGTIMGERFLFFASVGFCLVLSFFINKIVPDTELVSIKSFMDKRILFVLLPILLIFSIITVNRNADWANNLTLYKTDIKYVPNNARMHYYIGNELLISVYSQEIEPNMKKQMIDEAVNYLNTAIHIYDKYSDAHRVLGNGYLLREQYDSAEYQYKRAISLKPFDNEARNNLDVMYFNTKNYQKSIEVNYDIIKFDSTKYERYNNIGVCYMKMQKYDSAIIALKVGILKKPEYIQFNQNLALAYKLSNNRDSAKKYEAIVKKEIPQFSIY